nr:MAG TPA: hypothetical protein [Caudoviricetes sp.]
MVERLTGRGWAAAIYPAGAPLHPSAPGTAAQHRQQGRTYRMQGRPHKARHTRPDAGHAAPDTRPPTPGRSGLCRTLKDCQRVRN